MISSMQRVEIVGPNSLLTPLLEAVQALGTLHIVEIPLADTGATAGLHRIRHTEEQLRERSSLNDLVDILAEAISFIPPSTKAALALSQGCIEHYENWKNADIGAIGVSARSMHAAFRSLLRRKNNLANDIQAIAVYEEAVKSLAPLIQDPPHPGYEYTGLILDAKAEPARELLRSELEKCTNGSFLYREAPLSLKRIAALVGFDGRYAHAVQHLIIDSGIGKMSVPRHLRDKPFLEAVARIKDDLISLRKNAAALEEQTTVLYTKKGAELLALYDVCRDRRARFEAMQAMATTEHGFVLRGWVPTRDFEALRKSATVATGSVALVRALRFVAEDAPPVLLDNGPAVKQFEPLLGLFPLPRYGTIDSTVFLASAFPPIFGLMLADIGYGLILGAGAAVAALVSRAGSLARKISFIAASCAFFAVVFGAVFGEFFGEIGVQVFGLRPLWRERFSFGPDERVKTLIGYMAIALTIGIVHVLLALVLAFVNSRRTGDRGKAVDSLAKIAGVFVMLFAVGRMTSLLPPVFTTLGAAALVAFAALMLHQVIHNPAHGLLLPLEVLGTVGNILSYVRIMAVGLVSVVLAFLANLFGDMIANVVLAVVVSLLVHTLNLALGIIDPTIQGLRLHYVEFSSKFYLGGGYPYAPFRKLGGHA